MAELLEKVRCIPPYLRRMNGTLKMLQLGTCSNASEMATVNDAMSEYFHGTDRFGWPPHPCDEIMKSHVNFVMKDFSDKEKEVEDSNQIINNG